MENPSPSETATVAGDFDPEVEAPSTGARWAMAGVLAVLIAVVGLVAWNVMSTAGGDGADSPEAAIDALLDALEASDLDAAIATLVPGERERADEMVGELLAELSRLGILADDIDRTAISGFDFEVMDRTLTSRSTGDDVALVAIGGTLRTTVFGNDLPLGSALTGVIPIAPGDIPSPPPAEMDFALATVRHDGGWYVSIGHTLAENQRLENGWPVPDPSGAIAPQGAASPEAAAQALLDALDAVDPAAVLALLNPGEADAAHRHAPNLLQDSAASAMENDFTIDDIEYRVEVDGDRADIHIDLLVMTTVVEDPWTETMISSTVRYEDGCINVKDTYSPPRDDQYQNEPIPLPGFAFEEDGSTTYCPTGDQMFGMSFLAGSLFGTAGLPSIGLVRHDGEWYISPVRTITNSFLSSWRDIPDGGGAAFFEGLLSPSSPMSMDHLPAPSTTFEVTDTTEG